MSAKVDVSLLIPVVERHDDLAALYASLHAEFERAGRRIETIFLVSPEFPEALEQVLALHEADAEGVRVLRFARPVNEASALGAGFEHARGAILFTAPSYFDADPSCVPRLLESISGGADLAFASRVERRDGALKQVQSVLFNRLASWATGTEYRDLASATRAIRASVAAEVPLYGEFHRFLPGLVHHVGFKVEEVAVPQSANAAAPRVYRPRTYLYRVLDLLSMFFLSHFTRRPLRLFGAVGAIFGVLGAAILLVVGVQRLLGEALADRPIVVLATLLLGLGVQALTIGLLGELLLFFHASEIRDYRVGTVYEADEPPLADPHQDDR